LDEATDQAPDLILLAVMMLIMDGFTVCHILKGNDKTRMIPIVIMTALDGFEDRINGIKAGADDFLTKIVFTRRAGISTRRLGMVLWRFSMMSTGAHMLEKP
jgi:DNA-binding response OmpR family regulator